MTRPLPGSMRPDLSAHQLQAMRTRMCEVYLDALVSWRSCVVRDALWAGVVPPYFARSTRQLLVTYSGEDPANSVSLWKPTAWKPDIYLQSDDSLILHARVSAAALDTLCRRIRVAQAWEKPRFLQSCSLGACCRLSGNRQLCETHAPRGSLREGRRAARRARRRRGRAGARGRAKVAAQRRLTHRSRRAVPAVAAAAAPRPPPRSLARRTPNITPHSPLQRRPAPARAATRLNS